MILITSRSWWISMRYWEKSYYQERMEYRGANVWEDEWMDGKSWFSSFAFNFICNFTLGVNSKICFDYSSWIISLEERLNILIITTNYVYQKKKTPSLKYILPMSFAYVIHKYWTKKIHVRTNVDFLAPC